MKQLGTVLVFSPNVDKKEIESFLLSIMKKQNDDGINLIDAYTGLHEFDPEHGYPVFYVP